MGKSKIRVAFIGRHLVPYHTPIYRGLAKSEMLDLTVIYLSDIGIRPIWDEEFEGNIAWDSILLEGYKYKILKNVSNNEISGIMSRFNPDILSELRKTKYDIVVIQGYSTASDWLALLIAKLRGIKVIWRGEVVDRNGAVGLKSVAGKFLIKNYLRLCDKVLYSCFGNYNYLYKYVKNKSDLVFFPCAVDNRYYDYIYQINKTKREDLRDEIGIRNNDIVIISSGRLINRKRPLDLVAAIKGLGEIENIKLLFVGGGPLEKEINKTCKENNIQVIITGFVNQEQTAKYYSIGDIYVQMSDYDPSPKAINEAMNFALPVIASAEIGTSKDLVVDGYNGHLVNARDVSKLTIRLKDLIFDRDKRIKMGFNSKKIIKSWCIEADVKSFNDVACNLYRQA